MLTAFGGLRLQEESGGYCYRREHRSQANKVNSKNKVTHSATNVEEKCRCTAELAGGVERLHKTVRNRMFRRPTGM